MSLTSKSTLSLRKKDVQQQKKAGTAYRRLVFAHKASAGETGVTFTALVQPSEMAALGFTNPNSADILAANILFYKKNLTVISSARGVLMQDLSYTVPTSQRIEFQGFTALQDEIFTFLLETGVKDGLNVVDASPIIATGELAIGDTDFNVGTPFEVNKYNTQQVGSVLVFRDGVIQFRNPSNGTVGGNYQEVDNGSGLGTIIRFNEAPVSEASSIVVWGNLLAERPDGSMMAAIESLAGQLDQMIPTLAALAGVPETTFQGAPNNQDLKQFGDIVLGLLNLQIPIVQQMTAAGTINVGAITTPPTKGATVTLDKVSYGRFGDIGKFRYEYQQTSAGTIGSGHYLYSLPAGLEFDPTKVTFVTTAVVDLDAIDAVKAGMGVAAIRILAGGASGSGGFIIPYDATRFRVMQMNYFSIMQPQSSAFFNYAESQLEYFIEFDAPIKNWNATQTVREALGL